MKVSLNSLKEFTDINMSVDELVAKIGAQLGAVEAVYQSGAKYDGCVVAKIVSCQKHSDADKLNVCWIDDGGSAPNVERNSDGLVQVVCGAPNAREGLLVAWLAPGSTVPSTYYGDKFVLSAREIRGVVSNGMLASKQELAINNDHDGILEINEPVAPGTPFKNLYGLDDVTIEIENKMFTHRPDCFGALGIAREIAGIQGLQFSSPDWYKNQPEFSSAKQLPLTVQNEVSKLVPRFTAVAMSGITVQPSPVWLQALLTRVAIKPINNVVDITNYLAYITAQPLHAYDYDKVKARSTGEAKLVIRKPRKDETVALLNGKTITPRDEAVMIATDTELVGVGGVMGGTTTEVDEHTKNIIIEVATFDMYNVRRTSMTHGLFTDAVTRFNKGQSPLQNDRVIAKAMQMMSELTGAQQASDVIDDRGELHVNEVVQITDEFINARLGLNLDSKDIEATLKNVEFQIDQGESMQVKAPFWRTDIAIKEDVVEEIGRLAGFDKMPLDLPKRTVSPTKVDKYLMLKRNLRSKLASFGANEVLTYSFVHGKLLEKAGQDASHAFKLSNALSPDVQYYRLSLTPSLLAHVHPNIKSGHDQFALFEIGKVHGKTEIDETGVPREFGRVAMVLAGKTNTSAAYFQAKKYVESLTNGAFKMVAYDEKLLKGHELMTQMTAPYDSSRSAMLLNDQDIVVGVVGEFKLGVVRAYKLPTYSAGFELFLSAAGQHLSPKYAPLSKYPSASQDICLEIDEHLAYGALLTSLSEVVESNKAEDLLIAIAPVDIYTSRELSGKKRLTFRLTAVSHSRTLTDEVLSNLLDKASEQLAQAHGAIRV